MQLGTLIGPIIGMRINYTMYEAQSQLYLSKFVQYCCKKHHFDVYQNKFQPISEAVLTIRLILSLEQTLVHYLSPIVQFMSTGMCTET